MLGEECLAISPSYAHGLILMSHTLCIQDTPDTAVAPLPHTGETGETELTTPQDVADRDEAETITVSSELQIVFCAYIL